MNLPKQADGTGCGIRGEALARDRGDGKTLETGGLQMAVAAKNRDEKRAGSFAEIQQISASTSTGNRHGTEDALLRLATHREHMVID